MTPTAIKLLEGMTNGVRYSASELGVIALGRMKKTGTPRTPQGSALAIGKTLRALQKSGHIQWTPGSATGARGYYTHTKY